MENTRNVLCGFLKNTKMDTGWLWLIVGYCVAFTVSECPVKLEPGTVVVRYGDRVSANCTVSEDHHGIGWEASEGSVDLKTGVKFVTWKVDTLTDWDIGPRCFGNFPTKTGPPLQCDEKLNITVYKPPDSVSISGASADVPLVEGDSYRLVCEVKNIAPVQHLTVRWYGGKSELEHQTFYNNLTNTPLNVTSTLWMRPTSADDGEQYSCVAELDLGPEGPQPPPSTESEPLKLIVFYAPIFSRVDDEILEVTEGEVAIMNCSAQGKPPPTYSWSSNTEPQVPQRSETLITSSSLSPDTYYYSCTANNLLGHETKSFTVNVIPKGDQTVLWTVIGVGLFVAALLILGYLFHRSREGGNSVV
ncbi:hypothetical protein GJAV_G00220150 [Gymnothorax javanicus]|nr:hypothetical protein GJAV_G00220150 [Gymnothorax javanicus]